MLGFVLYSQHNDSYAFRDYPPLTKYQRLHQDMIPDMSGESCPGVRRCEECREILAKWDEPLRALILKKRTYDVSTTYDGVVVASHAFKQVYDGDKLTGLAFRALPDDPDFLSIQAVRTVSFDAERRKTRFLDKCQKCGRYKTVAGATPVFLIEGNSIGALEFVRTDVEFASGDEKHPLILCGVSAGRVLSNYNIKGLDLVPF